MSCSNLLLPCIYGCESLFIHGAWQSFCAHFTTPQLCHIIHRIQNDFYHDGMNCFGFNQLYCAFQKFIEENSEIAMRLSFFSLISLDCAVSSHLCVWAERGLGVGGMGRGEWNTQHCTIYLISVIREMFSWKIKENSYCFRRCVGEINKNWNQRLSKGKKTAKNDRQKMQTQEKKKKKKTDWNSFIWALNNYYSLQRCRALKSTRTVIGTGFMSKHTHNQHIGGNPNICAK